MSYVYTNSEPGLWTVGYYAPNGEWIAESDHDSPGKAAARVNFLNGSAPDYDGSGSPKAPRIKQYKIIALSNRSIKLDEIELNEHARDGWVVISVHIYDNGNAQVILERDAAVAGRTPMETEPYASSALDREQWLDANLKADEDQAGIRKMLFDEER
jgi:hypothetical protein